MMTVMAILECGGHATALDEERAAAWGSGSMGVRSVFRPFFYGLKKKQVVDGDRSLLWSFFSTI
jgi:hypothetical protein